MQNNILIVGSGAREHIIAKAIKKSSEVDNVFCVGSNMNPGIKELCTKLFLGDINDPDFVLQKALDHSITMAIVGPENPLLFGVSDILSEANIKVIGPKKNLAQIETSKTFTRNLFKEYDIPGSPKYQSFQSMKGVKNYLSQIGNNYVVKYDGLAGGKGVKVSGDHLKSYKEAIEFCKSIVKQGGRFLIEEKFIGEEFSLMSFCDGATIKHMPAVQDHKRAYEDDKGPNTGGMGTYSDINHSLPFLTRSDMEEAKSINTATADALMDKFGEGYVGILYGGFMCTENGVKLIEYNARFGDPEVMNILSILKTDFFNICQAITNKTLDKIDIEFENKATVCKYAVPEGYPDDPIKGERIFISKENMDDGLYFASVDLRDGGFIESGSRTVVSVGVGNTITEAEMISEKKINDVKGPLFHRKDIGTDRLIRKRIEFMDSLR
tara:strand:- start:19138 stop:20451 length:1314 start_codon:yes stop_codon:yes gene_type:complete